MNKKYSENRKAKWKVYKMPVSKKAPNKISKKKKATDAVYRRNANKVKVKIWSWADYYYECSICPARWKLLFDIHHIVFRSEHGQHKNIHHVDNLIHVCRDCHQKFHNSTYDRRPLIKDRLLHKLFDDETLLHRKQ